MNKGLGGRPAYDRLLMFKILVLQTYDNLSDDQTEYQIHDRSSFRKFLGLEDRQAIADILDPTNTSADVYGDIAPLNHIRTFNPCQSKAELEFLVLRRLRRAIASTNRLPDLFPLLLAIAILN